MRGVHYVVIALFVVTSSQIAAKSGHSLQTFDRDVITAGNAIVKSLPNRFLRGSREDHNDLATEERSVYDALASMINEGVKKLPCAAEIILKNPRIGKATKKKSHVGEAAKKTSSQPLVVEEVLYAAEAMKEMESAEKYRLLKQAAEGADEALKKHWNPPRQTALYGNPVRDISGNVILSLPAWKSNFSGMWPIVVSPKHKDNIERVHAVFVRLCDENMKPTPAETSFLWRILGWNIEKNSKNSHRQHLERHAKRYVLMGLRKMQEDIKVWNEWNELSYPLKFGVLNYLLNLHYQRWVRMYNIFKRCQPDRILEPWNSKLRPDGSTGTSSAMALHAHSMQSSYPSLSFNVASTSKSDHAVFSKQSKRPFNGNTDTTSLPSKHLKKRNSKSVMPLLTKSTNSLLHPISAKPSRSSFGGPSNGYVPYKHPNVHSSQSLVLSPPALSPEDVETVLSLGNIYRKSSYKAPSVQ